ncbi:hypothetical protein M9H77_14023 [Catharanthus roseus]|uniref:Uncharacterized protein n=1 Tax=Catharanthus roseus TaxID=4058 RepID=A0ACC0BM60_CATRO|nr:hypothetical protein M9H77_14023 [Catharanthus roseus]
MESSMGEMPTKANELSQAQDVIEEKSFTMRKRTLVTLLKKKNQERKKIQPQFSNFLTTTCGTKQNHGMKAKEDMGKDLSIGFENTSLNHVLSLEGKINMEFVGVIHFENHEVNEVNHKEFGMIRVVFDPGGRRLKRASWKGLKVKEETPNYYSRVQLARTKQEDL